MEKIILPDSIEHIGESCFKHCFALTEVTIPKKIKILGKETFRECVRLKKVNLPEGLEEICASTFYKDKQLEEINFPSTLKYIDGKVFSSTNLKKVELNEGLITIGELAFDSCTNLQEIKLPKSIKKIGSRAFINCAELNNVDYPGPEVLLGDDIFSDSGLTEITIPEGITEIRSGTFERCRRLEKVTLPESLREINVNAFRYCNNLRSIDLPKGLENIKPGAFFSCSSLRRVTIPENVDNIFANTFSHCFQLSEVEFRGNIKGIGREAFWGTGLTKVVLPETIEEIEMCAFEDCQILGEINIPDSIKSIKHNAFKDCKNLKSMTMSKETHERLMLDLISAGVSDEIIWQKRIDQINEIKSVFIDETYYTNEHMNMILYNMISALGFDETIRLTYNPPIIPEEFKKGEIYGRPNYELFFNDKYSFIGDFGVVLEIFKSINPLINNSHKKNKEEIAILKYLNQRLEEGYNGTLRDLFNENEDIPIEVTLKISEIERKINKRVITDLLKSNKDTFEFLIRGDGQDAIAEHQVPAIRAMVEDCMIKLYKEYGEIDKVDFENYFRAKLEDASPYINSRKEEIIKRTLNIFNYNGFKNGLTNSCINSVKRVKESLGIGWKYKINQAFGLIGYSFRSMPDKFTDEEIRQVITALNMLSDEKLEIITERIPEVKENVNRAELYRFYANNYYPRTFTFANLHDLFLAIKLPTSEEFKEFYKKNKDDLLSLDLDLDDPTLRLFAKIHNNFNEIVNSPELKNIYESGNLTVTQIVDYLGTRNFANEKRGNEELARLARSIGNIASESEFEKVQRVFEITRKRERTSIPPLNVKRGKYRGRMLEPDDVMNLFAGNITTCCQAFGDAGEGAMILGSIEENGGIFVVEELNDKEKPINIIGQSLTIRQKGTKGNYDRLTFDNIEITDTVGSKLSYEDKKSILDIYIEAGKQAIEKDKEFLKSLLEKGLINEEQYNSLVLREVIVGTGYNDLEGIESLPNAKVVVPDEAYKKYRPWLDSTDGKAPNGSRGVPVILAKSDEKEEIKSIAKPADVPLWYGKVEASKDVDEITVDEISLIKIIEENSDKKQRTFTGDNIPSLEELKNKYYADNLKLSIGNNNKWYLLYEESRKIEIHDFSIASKLPYKSDNHKELSDAEIRNKLYELLLRSKDKTISYRPNLSDLSEVFEDAKNKGLIEINHGKYDDSLEVSISPENIKKLQEEKEKEEKKISELSEKIKMAGAPKEEGIDKLRQEFEEER